MDPEVLSELLEMPQLPAPPEAVILDLEDITPARAVDELLAALG